MAKRSLWKGPYINESFFQEVLLSKKKIKTTSRSTVILPFLIGKTVQVYNGKFFIPITISEEMVGYKLGEFVLTRLRHVYKKKKK
jgi:small subunit ribosomal protein S19